MLQKTRGLRYYFSLSFFLSDFVRLYLLGASRLVVSFFFILHDKYERRGVRMIKSKNCSQFTSSPLPRLSPRRSLFFFGSSSKFFILHHSCFRPCCSLFKILRGFLFSFLKTFFRGLWKSTGTSYLLIAILLLSLSTLQIIRLISLIKFFIGFIGLSFSKSLMHVARLSVWLAGIAL